MRIISGKYKGRKILGYNIEGTRPTMDRVKESLFATIQNYLDNAIVLDLFAGSGNLGIEALSNGAKACYFIDNNKVAIDTINKNLIDIKDAIVLKKDCFDALDYFKRNKLFFDIIILDPPYHDNLINKVLDKIYEYEILNKNGIIVCEFEEGNINCKYELIKEENMETKKFLFIKSKNGENSIFLLEKKEISFFYRIRLIGR